MTSLNALTPQKKHIYNLSLMKMLPISPLYISNLSLVPVLAIRRVIFRCYFEHFLRVPGLKKD